MMNWAPESKRPTKRICFGELTGVSGAGGQQDRNGRWHAGWMSGSDGRPKAAPRVNGIMLIIVGETGTRKYALSRLRMKANSMAIGRGKPWVSHGTAATDMWSDIVRAQIGPNFASHYRSARGTLSITLATSDKLRSAIVDLLIYFLSVRFATRGVGVCV